MSPAPNPVSLSSPPSPQLSLEEAEARMFGTAVTPKNRARSKSHPLRFGGKRTIPGTNSPHLPYGESDPTSYPSLTFPRTPHIPDVTIPMHNPFAPAPVFDPNTTMPAHHPSAPFPVYNPAPVPHTHSPMPVYDPNAPAPVCDPNAPAPVCDPNTPAPVFHHNTPAVCDPTAPATVCDINTPAPTFDPNSPTPMFNPNSPAPMFDPNSPASMHDPNSPVPIHGHSGPLFDHNSNSIDEFAKSLGLTDAVATLRSTISSASIPKLSEAAGITMSIIQVVSTSIRVSSLIYLSILVLLMFSAGEKIQRRRFQSPCKPCMHSYFIYRCHSTKARKGREGDGSRAVRGTQSSNSVSAGSCATLPPLSSSQ